MFIITIGATKGGVGKTTVSANLAGILRDLGMRVLLIDADVQPSLSKYFRLSHVAPDGLTQMVRSGVLTDDCLSVVSLPSDSFRNALQVPPDAEIRLVRSDTRDGTLQDWMISREDRLVRFSLALRTDAVQERFDFAIIDTQGAVGHLQSSAIQVADLVVSPASPDVLSAREFIAGSEQLIDRIEQVGNMGLRMPGMKAFVNRADNTLDARSMVKQIQSSFIQLKGRVSVAQTTIPALVVFRNAATKFVPVHWLDPQRAGLAMHQLLWELIPPLAGHCAPGCHYHPDQAVPASPCAGDAPGDVRPPSSSEQQ